MIIRAQRKDALEQWAQCITNLLDESQTTEKNELRI